ncbi:MAG: hypothetical protein N4A74_00835 [Carboxylicivirga sp.]|jgi:hypothetical protein|nr:hypothetical protein [Carboxylicivirga sp.]
MNTYIKQLIEKIEKSTQKANFNFSEDDENIEVDSSFATDFLQGKPERISKVVGIDKYNFPGTNKLNDQQINELLQAIEILLKAYNWEFMFPENLSSSVKYQFIIDHWDTKHVHCQKGLVQVETCKFDESNCPFPGHCKVCYSFKCNEDKTPSLNKEMIDFHSLIPEINGDDQVSREDVEKFKALIKQPKNESFITGIHNYCDGRCKQCSYTDRCSSYALNSQFDMPNESDGEVNDQQLKVIFKATTELIEEELSKKGIDITEALAEMDEMESLSLEKHSLEKLAESYAEKTKRWLESNQMEIESRIVAKPEIGIQQAFESISWFQLFIPAKISRCVSGIAKADTSETDHYDAHGSAKIALIGIDESINAWETIMTFIPQKEDSTLNILRHLSKLRSELENIVPEARNFVRPGFDE